MEEMEGIDPGPFDLARTPVKGVVLALLMGVILAGAMGYISFYGRSLTWLIWGAQIWIIFQFSRELPLFRLMGSMAPYLLWLFFYLIWAMIVAPNTSYALAFKIVVTTVILAFCMAILTAKPLYLRTFANMAQLAVVANFILWFLLQWSSKVALVVMKVSKQTDPDMSSFTRYGGMFGNANMLGYVCLIATILSVLAHPLIGWIGRLTCLPLLYLSASRKSVVLYVLILVIYVLIVQRRSAKFWALTATMVFSMVMVFALSAGFRNESRAVADNPTISRIMDLQEKNTAEQGGQTRVELFNRWIAVLADEPWFGYGLGAMAGTSYDEDHPGKILIKGPYPLGTHNTYLGVWIETGPVGFIAFLVMLFYYAKLCLFTSEGPIAKWVLTSLLVVNLAFMFVSHSHLFCFEGKLTVSLLFLLPSCMGLSQLVHWQTEPN